MNEGRRRHWKLILWVYEHFSRFWRRMSLKSQNYFKLYHGSYKVAPELKIELKSVSSRNVHTSFVFDHCIFTRFSIRHGRPDPGPAPKKSDVTWLMTNCISHQLWWVQGLIGPSWKYIDTFRLMFYSGYLPSQLSAVGVAQSDVLSRRYFGSWLDDACPLAIASFTELF